MAALAASSALWRPRGSRSRHGSSRHRHLPKAASGHTENPPKPKPAEVFLACVPLVGFEAVGAALGDAYPSQLEHVMVLVRRFDRAGSGEETSTVVCYDFLPVDPLAPATAAAMLSGGEVAGDLRERPLRGVPSRRCWKVGTYVPSEAHSAETSTSSSGGSDAHAAARVSPPVPFAAVPSPGPEKHVRGARRGARGAPHRKRRALRRVDTHAPERDARGMRGEDGTAREPRTANREPRTANREPRARRARRREVSKRRSRRSLFR